ncbi:MULTISPECIES: hypothetical protein [Actinoalloteichus]|uniref:Uncharacterized protein n=1 Tax=Actinoalloteichus fjordicus TaxID=1612552 RepID=A0AAC9LAA5_9PSEU|nr:MULTISPECIES: hypothetical protein [Actinoalloteichus]APU12700.1 hypothetical protein UA74_03085 [Actinoalloteichus fjordicus]APU18670.1 hypothetical protein UA75_03175 [Actinoalloteichus sp. GBA129-24]
MTNAQSLEDRIATRIQASSLGVAVADPVNGPDQGVYIDNPYNAINPSVQTRFGKDPRKRIVQYAPGSDTLLSVIPPIKAKSLGYGDTPPSHAERVKAYLDWGAARAVGHPFIGVCESFNTVVIAILAAKNSPLADGTVIEYIGVKQGNLGHAIAVIGRANQTESVGQTIPAPGLWGADCIVVDQWYALQAGTVPVFHVAGPHADTDYVAFLTTGTTRTGLYGTFTKDGTRANINLRS